MIDRLLGAAGGVPGLDAAAHRRPRGGARAGWVPSRESVRQCLKKAASSPGGRNGASPPEQDAAFVAAMEGIRDLYAMPPDLRNPGLPPSPASNRLRRRARRIQPHLTPKHGSWLNIAEIEISALSRRAAAVLLPARRNQSATLGQRSSPPLMQGKNGCAYFIPISFCLDIRLALTAASSIALPDLNPAIAFAAFPRDLRVSSMDNRQRPSTSRHDPYKHPQPYPVGRSRSLDFAKVTDNWAAKAPLPGSCPRRRSHLPSKMRPPPNSQRKGRARPSAALARDLESLS
ncbi:MAG: hypothetical protein R3F11_27685 [Verrucomicrobiales bacterium]